LLNFLFKFQNFKALWKNEDTDNDNEAPSTAKLRRKTSEKKQQPVPALSSSPTEEVQKEKKKSSKKQAKSTGAGLRAGQVSQEGASGSEHVHNGETDIPGFEDQGDCIHMYSTLFPQVIGEVLAF
jgi:hypothetical protein